MAYDETPLPLKGHTMSNSEKLSFLTRAALAVDAKMNRTPADGEVATTESKNSVKAVLIGAGVLAAAGVTTTIFVVRNVRKAAGEMETPSDENIED